MSNCLAYSVFGYGAEREKNSFQFSSYFRGLNLNLRVIPLLYPGWKCYVAMDEQTYESELKSYWDYHVSGGVMHISVKPRKPLCEMMLYRMAAIWEGFDRVLCRDSDSLISYRERQAVQVWIDGGRIMHCMTDSISHTSALMGGMIGIQSAQFKKRIACDTFPEFMHLQKGIDFKVKGSDQVFLNKEILPRVHDSLTEHYCLGLPQSFRGHCFTSIQDVDLGLPQEYKETDYLCQHIGAAGMREIGVLKFLETFGVNSDYYEEIEKKYTKYFYWWL